MQDDTIVAISTPIGESAIGIVRLSGKDSLKIADRIFKGKNGVLPSKFKSHSVHYGWIIGSNQLPVTRKIKKSSIKHQASSIVILLMRCC